MRSSAELDREVRLCVYRRFLADGKPPSHVEVGEELESGAEEAEAAFRRLEQARVLVLLPETLEIWMANPLSAIPTDFVVNTPLGEYFANCIWDAFGVIAMLGREGSVCTHCGCCRSPMELRVEADALQPADGVAHFAVPARSWWDNIGFT